MHQFIRYDLKTGDIIGEFSSSSAEVLPRPLPDEGYLELEDEQQSNLDRPADPFRTRLRGRVVDGKVQRVVRESIYSAELELTADLQDIDGDGVLDAPADGETEIVLKLGMISGGKAATEGASRVRFRTTRGTLSQRFVETSGGFAEVRLKAIAETTQAVITASAEGCQPVSLTIEFVPVEEFADVKSDPAEKHTTRTRSTKR